VSSDDATDNLLLFRHKETLPNGKTRVVEVMPFPTAQEITRMQQQPNVHSKVQWGMQNDRVFLGNLYISASYICDTEQWRNSSAQSEPMNGLFTWKKLPALFLVGYMNHPAYLNAGESAASKHRRKARYLATVMSEADADERYGRYTESKVRRQKEKYFCAFEDEHGTAMLVDGNPESADGSSPVPCNKAAGQWEFVEKYGQCMFINEPSPPSSSCPPSYPNPAEWGYANCICTYDTEEKMVSIYTTREILPNEELFMLYFNSADDDYPRGCPVKQTRFDFHDPVQGNSYWEFTYPDFVYAKFNIPR